MDVFINKPLETLLPFVNFIVAVTNIVILSFLIPTIIKLSKRELDLFLSYLSLLIFLAGFSGYWFSKAFVNSNYDGTIYLVFLSAMIALSHYSLLALRKSLDQGFEIKTSYKGILIVFISLLLFQASLNNTTISATFLLISIILVAIFYRNTSPILKYKRAIIFIIFILLLIISTIFDFLQSLNGVLCLLFVFTTSILLSITFLYEIGYKYSLLKEKSSQTISFLESSSRTLRELSKVLEDIGKIKLKLDKGIFSANHDITKLINKMISTTSEMSNIKDELISLKGTLIKTLDEFNNLPNLKTNTDETKKEILNNLRKSQNICELCKNSLGELSSKFSQISSDFYKVIQTFRELSNSLVTQKMILENLDKNISKIGKNMSLVSYVSISGIMEFQKKNDIGMVSVYSEIKNVSDQAHNDIAKTKSLIHELTLTNDELEYLNKKVLDELYRAISTIDLIVNESTNFQKSIQEYLNTISQLIDKYTQKPEELINILLENKDKFTELFTTTTETYELLEELFNSLMKINEFVTPLRNSIFLVKETLSKVDKGIREIKVIVEKLLKEVVY